MRLIVFTSQTNTRDTLISDKTYITQWKVLLWSDGTPWDDVDDAAVEDNAAAIRAEYLEPNGIHDLEMGQLEPRVWWIRACPEKTLMSDFYENGEAGAEGNLVWHTFYTFTGEGGADCITQDFDYIPSELVRSVLKVVVQ